MTEDAWTAADVNRWRRRAARRLSAGDWYVVVFGILLVGAMAVAILRFVTWPLLACPPSGVPLCAALLRLAPAVSAALTGLLAFTVSALVGPLSASDADAFWLLALPADRAGVLAAPLRRVALAAVLTGAAASGAVTLTFGAGPGWAAAVLAAALLGVGSALRREQDGPRAVRTPALLGLAAVVGGGIVTLLLPAWADPVGACGAGLLVAIAAPLWWASRSRLGTLDRFSLTAVGRRRSGLAGATASLDSALLLDLVSLRLAGTGRRRLRPRGTGLTALAGTDLARLLNRSPRLLAGVVGTLPLLLLVAAVPRTIALLPLVLVPALGLLLTEVRRLCGSAGLARLTPLSDGAQRLAWSAGALGAAAVLGVLFCGVLVAAGVPGLDAAGLAASGVLGGLAGAWRWVASPPPDFGSGYVMTDAGALPVGAITDAVRGFDVAASVACTIGFGAAPLTCLLVAAAGLAIVLRRLWTPAVR